MAVAVLATMVVEPAFLAFSPYPGPYPLASVENMATALLVAAYAADVAFNFFVRPKPWGLRTCQGFKGLGFGFWTLNTLRAPALLLLRGLPLKPPHPFP
jgi:hypothetical protein